MNVALEVDVYNFSIKIHVSSYCKDDFNEQAQVILEF